MTGQFRVQAKLVVAAIRSGLLNRSRALLFRLRVGLAGRWSEVAAATTGIVFVASIVLMAFFGTGLSGLLGGKDAVEPVADLLLQMGAALIGATTIAFTLVMFAMQVNVERMPYGLFRRFSSDPPLMGAFGFTFLLSIAVAVASIVRSAALVPWLLFSLAWATVAIFGLFLFAYRRALKLISPAEQLGFVVRSAQRDLAWWDRRATLVTRRTPLKDPPSDSDWDHARIAFFLANKRWTETSRKAVEHMIAYARRYAETGDYEVCLVALNGLVTINQAYIQAKGRSFVPPSPFFDIPHLEDGFLTHGLEELRLLIDVSLTRADERQVCLGLEAFAVLCSRYAAVDYGKPQTMTHAHLAMSYLTGAVQSVVSREMTDVVMAGVRYVGEAARTMIARDGALDATSGIEALGVIGEAMARKLDTQPAAQVAIGQLSNITAFLLLSPAHRGRLALQSTVDAVMLVSHGVLAIKATAPGVRVHSMNLAAFFGMTSLGGLTARLTDYGNGVLDEAADPDRVADLAETLHEFVEVLRERLKTLLLTSIMLRSSLTFDLISWIPHVTEVLLAVATADHCPDGLRRRLERDAIGLGQLFTWIPEDAGMMEHADHSRLTEQLFELVLKARRRDSDQGVVQFSRVLLGWTFKAGNVGAGRYIMQRGLTGLAILSLSPDGPYDPRGLKLAILDELAKRSAAQPTFDEVATLLRRGHSDVSSSLDVIENAAESVPAGQLDELLCEIADLLSPPPSQA